MRIHTALFVAILVALVSAPVATAQDYAADPDADLPNLHQHPPALAPELAQKVTPGTGSKRVGSVNIVDVMVASGYDIAGEDRGNEPSLAANPLNPNQITLMSFSGSNWPSGGNSSIYYSSDGGSTWSYSLTVPPPPGTSTTYYCPCDQTPDYDRNGVLNATFLHYNLNGSIASVYSAQAAQPNVAASWTYRTSSGAAQKTNLSSLIYPDQPWLWSGPSTDDNSLTNVVVAYDNFDSGYINIEARNATSPGASPLDFSRDASTNSDGRKYNDGMNAGNRLAVAADGKIWTLYQRLVTALGGGVKQLTYLVTVSTDGGFTYGVSNSDHASGAKIVAANVYSFQGNGSKVAGVNALLGGVDAITADPTTSGKAWIVYGSRPTTSGLDQLWLVPATYAAGSVTLGTARVISPAAVSAYLPSVAVLPSGEVGVLFLTLSGGTMTWRLVQTTDGGATLAAATDLTSFTSPFADNGQTNQRILGDYVQLRAVGCQFYGAFPARGSGVNSASSIDPYFLKATAATACSLPTATSLSPSSICAGTASATVAVNGTGFSVGASGRFAQGLRTTTFGSATQVSLALRASDVANAGTFNVDVIGALPAGGLTGALPLTIAPVAGSPAASLRVQRSTPNLRLTWSATSNTNNYNVRRCAPAGGPCTPATIASPTTNQYDDPVAGNGTGYWYLVDAVNGCGSTP